MRTSGIPKIIRRRKTLTRTIVALAAGLAAAILTLAITRPPGPGLDPDSAAYIGAAESLAHGHGYRIPITSWASADTTAPLAHFPPGYPTALAVSISLGIPTRQAARAVNAAAALVDVGLATWLVALVAGEIAAAILALALLIMPAFEQAHLPVLSEPLFLACLTVTLAAMYVAATSPTERERLGWSLASGCASAAAVMVRYVGISACCGASLWSLLLPGTLRARVKRTVIATIPWVLACAAWVIRTRRDSGSGAIRKLGAYGGLGETLREGIATVVGWLVPLSPDDTLPGRRWIALAGAVLLLVAVGLGLRRRDRLTSESLAPAIEAAPSSPDHAISIVAAAFLLAIGYVLVLLASRLFADPGIPFDYRLLLPVFLLAMLIAAISIRSWWQGARLAGRLLCGALVLAWLVASYHVSSDDVDWAFENGYDLAGDPWRGSALVAWARDNAAGHALYSNWPSVLVLQLGRASHETPMTPDTLVLRQFADSVAVRQGVVLAFDIAAPGLIGVDELLRAPRLKRVARLADGSVFIAEP